MSRRRALVSVADKTGIAEFAAGLVAEGFEILSTGGTAKVIIGAGVPVTPVEDVTGFPEMLDGRVKTLHPMIHGGILGRRDVASHVAAMREHGILPIDLVCVVFYLFEGNESIEQIDIGGPSMVRSAAKNHEHVLVVTSPRQYAEVLDALREDRVTAELRGRLAREAFVRTAQYDAAIARWLETVDGKDELPSQLVLSLRRDRVLRYGENPHQKAAFYVGEDPGEASVATGRMRTGKKDLSYNNIMDLDGALELAREFEGPAAVIVKHTNPCGCAVAETPREAFAKALECDPVSAFGCIVALNRDVTAEVAEEIAAPNRFVEAIVAPEFDAAAIEILTTRQKWGKNLRLVAVGELTERRSRLVARQVIGGLLVQQRDLALLNPDLPGGWEVVTDRAPTAEESANLRFGWAVVKHVKSNAIVLANDLAAVGVGAGQMSRVESAEIAVNRAGERAKGSVCASDAFFPFPDGLAIAADAGATAFVQPGGSMRDKAVIEEANRRGVAMVMTRMRHFKH